MQGDEFDEEFFEVVLGSGYPMKQLKEPLEIGKLCSHYFAPSDFDIDINCCKKSRLKASKKLKTSPQILVLKIDRASLKNASISAPFKITKSELGDCTYQLKGMVQLRAAHYTA
mgnify:CR=1 FL=1